LLNKAAIGYGAIFSLGVVLGLGVKLDATHQIAAERQHFIEASRNEAGIAVRRVHNALQEIYENLRTLTSLPSIRKVDRHGTNLGEDGRQTIQQVYNNLASNVSVSEVYIVPADLDPERIDPATGKPEEPILMFDELIVNAGTRAAQTQGQKIAATLSDDAPPEDEIYEYRQFRDQFTWLKQNYPDTNSINGLDVPMISGPEVITCDNTTYIYTRNDADRMGVLFSVPFYGPDNQLKGSVTAIIRSNSLRQLLPKENFALINTGYGYATHASEQGQERASAKWVSEGKVDPNLIYSEILPVTFVDPKSTWLLWVGYPDTAFYNGSDYQSVRALEYVRYAVVAILSLAAMGFWALILRNMKLAHGMSATLERRVAERTAEIRYMATHDALTGLPNRTLLREKMADALAGVEHGEKIAVLWLDLDHFKSVNDTLGHAVGDTLLKLVTARLKRCVREGDVVARVGGDEFVILQHGLDKPDQAGALARRIIDKLSEPFDIDDHQVVIGASIGIAFSPADGIECELLLRNADMALYRAKGDGRGTCRFFAPAMDAELQERRSLELDLRRALAAKEFVL
jgi:diguanylate cyclase (GGDEF)-like protein